MRTDWAETEEQTKEYRASTIATIRSIQKEIEQPFKSYKLPVFVIVDSNREEWRC